MARALRLHSGLPLKFWVDGALTAVHIINRLPTPVIGNVSPYEKFLKRKPDYSQLRAFGCLAVASNPTRTTDKFSSIGLPCVFLGYLSEKKGFKLLNLMTGECFTSRDVKFYEHIFPYNTNQTIPYYQPVPISMPEGETLKEKPIAEEGFEWNEMMELCNLTWKNN